MTRGDAAVRPGFVVSVGMVEGQNSRCQVVDVINLIGRKARVITRMC